MHYDPLGRGRTFVLHNVFQEILNKILCSQGSGGQKCPRSGIQGAEVFVFFLKKRLVWLQVSIQGATYRAFTLR